MSRLHPLSEMKFATAVIIINVVFSITMLIAMIAFVDDVASTLTIYFDLGEEEKWQIISKFKTPLITALLGLLAFNIISMLVCFFYSKRLFTCLDNLIKQMDLILVGEDKEFPNSNFSRQFSSIERKLNQIKNEFQEGKVIKKSSANDMKAISKYLQSLDTGSTPPKPLTLSTSPQLAEQLNNLAAHFYPEKLDDAK